VHSRSLNTRAIVREVVQGGERRDNPRDLVFGPADPARFQSAAEVIDQRSTWADPEAYDRQAKKLREMFDGNIATSAERARPPPDWSLRVAIVGSSEILMSDGGLLNYVNEHPREHRSSPHSGKLCRRRLRQGRRGEGSLSR